MSTSSRTLNAGSGDESPDAVELSTFSQIAEAQQTHDVRRPETREAVVPTCKFWLVCLGVCPGLLLSILDSSVLATSLYSIGVEFKEHSLINWVVLAYTLGYTGFIVASSTLSDIVGQHFALMASYFLFLMFSVACALAQDVKQLIIFRTFQGIGASGLYALSILLLTQQSPPQLRQYIGTIIGVVIATAGVLGPILGGLFTQYLSWRWIFVINSPICSIAMVFLYFCWSKEEREKQLRSWKQFDFVGTMLGIISSVFVVFAFQTAGESGPETWKSAVFILPVTMGLIFWIALFIVSYIIDRWFSDIIVPVFPISLFRNRLYTRSILTTLFMGYPYLLLIFLLPIRMQVVSGKSPLIAGLSLLPMLGTVALGSIVSGKINAMDNFLIETMRFGTQFMLFGCFALSTLGGPKDDAKVLGFLAFVGFGFGLCTAAATNVISVEVPIQQRASAHGILAQARLLGGTFGISASTVFLHNKVINRLKDILTSKEMASFDGDMKHLTGNSLKAVQSAYLKAFTQSAISATIAASLAVVSSFYGSRLLWGGVKQRHEAIIQEETERRVVEPSAPLPLQNAA